MHLLFVPAESLGSGVAATLIADAEARLAEHGVETAWLAGDIGSACAVGNELVGTCYEKCGWWRVGTMSATPEMTEGTLPLKGWRYEKSLTPRPD